MNVPREGESMYGSPTRPARPDYAIDYETGCWVWQKSVSKLGYPTRRQYRDYWGFANGSIPAGHDIHHKCKNRACVNPAHLEAMPRRQHDIEHFLNERGITFDLIRAIRAEGRKPGVQLMDTAARFGVAPATVQFYWDDRQGRWAEFLDDGPVGRPGVTCHLEECDVVFVPKRRDAKFCCPTHRGRHNGRKPEEAAKKVERQRRRRAALKTGRG